jgi:hypothetical protein
VHRDIQHSNAHNYGVLPRGHQSLHGKLNHQASHDQIRHSASHGRSLYTPSYNQGYNNYDQSNRGYSQNGFGFSPHFSHVGRIEGRATRTVGRGWASMRLAA